MCRRPIFRSSFLLLVLLFASAARASPWVADQGDGTYRNPILYADYSDPDVIRVGTDFYLTASSFNAVPGLPILHSKDLVNWELIGHVYGAQPPLDVYNKPQHGSGSWAPALRYHNGEFYIFYPDPGYGIYMTKASKPAGPWSAPLLIKQVKGWIDPCPFWDDDGHAYLINAMSASRSALKSTLIISRMSPDGTRLLDAGTLVYDGHGADPTVEGPKFYKRNGYYYIFAPAGGVPRGWQLALRSRKIYGPYERKVVLAQGSTAINGPHQGAWVDTPGGESWFVHFQDQGPYGRVVHLQPLQWVDDWPVIGNHGEPVSTFRKPAVGKVYPIMTPATSDEFNDSSARSAVAVASQPTARLGISIGRLRFSARVCHRRARWTSQPLGRTQPAAAEIPRAALHSDTENDTDSAHSGGSGRTARHGRRLRSGHREERRQRSIAIRNNLQWSGSGCTRG